MAIEPKDDGSVTASSIQVPGLIKDDYGNEWTVPVDEAGYDELLTDPLALPKKDPRFHYQFVRADQVTAKATEGFRLVRREEVGISSVVTNADIGGPVMDSHVVHDLHLMKLPKELAERRYRAAKRLADDAVRQILDPPRLAGANPRDARTFTSGPEPFEAEATKPDLDHFREPNVRKL